MGNSKSSQKKAAKKQMAGFVPEAKTTVLVLRDKHNQIPKSTILQHFRCCNNTHIGMALWNMVEKEVNENVGTANAMVVAHVLSRFLEEMSDDLKLLQMVYGTLFMEDTQDEGNISVEHVRNKLDPVLNEAFTYAFVQGQIKALSAGTDDGNDSAAALTSQQQQSAIGAGSALLAAHNELDAIQATYASGAEAEATVLAEKDTHGVFVALKETLVDSIAKHGSAKQGLFLAALRTHCPRLLDPLREWVQFCVTVKVRATAHLIHRSKRKAVGEAPLGEIPVVSEAEAARARAHATQETNMAVVRQHLFLPVLLEEEDAGRLDHDAGFLMDKHIAFMLATILPSEYLVRNLRQIRYNEAHVPEVRAWVPLYNSRSQGLSMNQIRKYVFGYNAPMIWLVEFSVPALEAAQEPKRYIGGVCVPEQLLESKETNQLKNTELTGLFILCPKTDVTMMTEKQQAQFYFCSRSHRSKHGVGLGDQPNLEQMRFWLDGDLRHGHITTHTGTFMMDSVYSVEIWGCGDEDTLAYQKRMQRRDKALIQKLKAGPRPAWQDDPDKFLLELAGIRTDHSERVDV
eukprot:Clim_evm37s201 gene=Clim_evmTU37s201